MTAAAGLSADACGPRGGLFSTSAGGSAAGGGGADGNAVTVPAALPAPLPPALSLRPACLARTASSAQTVYSSPPSSRCDPHRSASRSTISRPRPAWADTDIEYGFVDGRVVPPPSVTSIRNSPSPVSAHAIRIIPESRALACRSELVTNSDSINTASSTSEPSTSRSYSAAASCDLAWRTLVEECGRKPVYEAGDTRATGMITPTDPSRESSPAGLFATAAHNGFDAQGEQDGNWQSALRNSAFSAHSGRVRPGSR